jgi:hypothetical protein
VAACPPTPIRTRLKRMPLKTRMLSLALERPRLRPLPGT